MVQAAGPVAVVKVLTPGAVLHGRKPVASIGSVEAEQKVSERVKVSFSLVHQKNPPATYSISWPVGEAIRTSWLYWLKSSAPSSRWSMFWVAALGVVAEAAATYCPLCDPKSPSRSWRFFQLR